MNPFKEIKIEGENRKGESLIVWCGQQLEDADLLSWKREMLDFILDWVNDEDYVEVQTSGTTGIPKTIRLKKLWMIESAKRTNRIFGLNKSTTALHCLPTNYIAGKMMLVRAFTEGFNLLPVSPSSTPFAKLKTKVHFAALTPYQLHHSLPGIKNNKHLQVLVGGGPVDFRLEQQLQDVNFEAIHSFGMTETCSHIALRKLNGNGKSKLFTVLDGIKIAPNNDSCLKIQVSYMDNAIISTNDVVNIMSPKEFEWVGRKDHIINSGGIKFNPEKIETKLSGVVTNNLFFIGGLRDDALGQKATLIIESDSDCKPIIEKIRLLYRSALDKYELPKQILIVKKIFTNLSGKILRSDTIQAIESGKLDIIYKYIL